MQSFAEFISSIILEELHPELKAIASSTPTRAGNTRVGKSGRSASKQSLLVAKIKELSERGEKTGLEGNMPAGSSRAYLPEEEEKKIVLDGKPSSIRVGTKVAIKATLDKFHNAHENNGLYLGAMQNEAEGDDQYVNQHYRILTKDGHEEGHFKSNKEYGIFPPLLDHDRKNHEYTQVGHCRDIGGAKEFSELTKTPEHPKGLTHYDFCKVLDRFHERENGHYYPNDERDKHLDKIEGHPLVQKFIDYHGNTGNPTYDYGQIQNLGVFEHPDGSKHIVARDHGFSAEVSKAYKDARKKQAQEKRKTIVW